MIKKESVIYIQHLNRIIALKFNKCEDTFLDLLKNILAMLNIPEDNVLEYCLKNDEGVITCMEKV
jgi:hypothetical protein